MPKLCHLYVNSPEHHFDQALKAEAEKVAAERTRAGFPVDVEVRYALGDEKRQFQQIADDGSARAHPDLFAIIPVNQDAIYSIIKETLSCHQGTTCVLLHQPLTRMLHSEREQFGSRLFSVAADQVEIGRIQGRQLAALLPRGGSVLYVQGRENSYATRQRTKGLMEELAKRPALKLNGYRVYGDWSGESVHAALEGWSRLGGRLDWVEAASAQNDDMALALSALVRQRGLSLPVTGVDGMEFGKGAVERGALAATVVQPLGIDYLLRLFEKLCAGAAEKDVVPADGNVLLAPESYPGLDRLRPVS